jgi:hypothetical protein
MAYHRGSVRKKVDYRTFMSVNHTRAGHCSLEASLSRFNIVPTAECEFGNRLQMEEHIISNCKLYEDHRATVMDILSENSKREYAKSVTEFLRLEEKRFVQGVCS